MKEVRFSRFTPVLSTLAIAAAVVVVQFINPSVKADPEVSGTPTFQIKNPIDRFVLAKLQSEKIEPSMPCTDEEFVRRITLDLNGSIPSLGEVKAFLADQSPNKRDKLIQKLLKSERYGDHYSALWGDLLREHTNSRPQEGTERGSYRNWIQDALNKNMPYDVFAKSLIDSIGNAEEDAAVNFYLRDENDRVETVNNVSTVFMGTRMACAQCHDHPFDKWTQADFHGLASFFGRVNVQIDPWATLLKVEKSKRLPEAAKPILEPHFKEAHEKVAEEKARYKKGIEVANAGGEGMMGMMDMLGVLSRGSKVLKELEAKLTPAEMQTMRQLLINGGVRKVSERTTGEYRMQAEGTDPKKKTNEIVMPVFPWDPTKKVDGKGWRRTKLAEFVVGDRQFAKVQANRLWASLFGRGIVDPVDDFRPKNPPSNPELLEYLTDEFIKSKFDNKALLALIASSSTYQRSSMPNASNRSDTALFSHMRLRHLTAEQVFDSILVATGKTGGLTGGAGYSMGMGREMIETKFRDMVQGGKGAPIQWAVDLPTPARAGSFMNLFNQPQRDETICKRDESGSIPQALEMFNGQTLNGAIRGSNTITQLISAKLPPQQAATEIFMSVLSRRPSSGELNALLRGAPTEPKSDKYREWLEDSYWALLNTREFAFVK